MKKISWAMVIQFAIVACTEQKIGVDHFQKPFPLTSNDSKNVDSGEKEGNREFLGHEFATVKETHVSYIARLWWHMVPGDMDKDGSHTPAISAFPHACMAITSENSSIWRPVELMVVRRCSR